MEWYTASLQVGQRPTDGSRFVFLEGKHRSAGVSASGALGKGGIDLAPLPRINTS